MHRAVHATAMLSSGRHPLGLPRANAVEGVIDSAPQSQAALGQAALRLPGALQQLRRHPRREVAGACAGLRAVSPGRRALLWQPRARQLRHSAPRVRVERAPTWRRRGRRAQCDRQPALSWAVCLIRASEHDVDGPCLGRIGVAALLRQREATIGARLPLEVLAACSGDDELPLHVPRRTIDAQLRAPLGEERRGSLEPEARLRVPRTHLIQRADAEQRVARARAAEGGADRHLRATRHERASDELGRLVGHGLGAVAAQGRPLGHASPEVFRGGRQSCVLGADEPHLVEPRAAGRPQVGDRQRQRRPAIPMRGGLPIDSPVGADDRDLPLEAPGRAGCGQLLRVEVGDA
mmetsp:Transcript_107768/g.310330  ORF Transcript_107768/g.310330 Transcript_107768/m.310330 type:complete len:350 (+) Transcript_107768:594-1643(+)